MRSVPRNLAAETRAEITYEKRPSPRPCADDGSSCILDGRHEPRMAPLIASRAEHAVSFAFAGQPHGVGDEPLMRDPDRPPNPRRDRRRNAPQSTPEGDRDPVKAARHHPGAYTTS